MKAVCAYLHQKDIPYTKKFISRKQPFELRCEVENYELFYNKLYACLETYKYIQKTGIQEFSIEKDGGTDLKRSERDQTGARL